MSTSKNQKNNIDSLKAIENAAKTYQTKALAKEAAIEAGGKDWSKTHRITPYGPTWIIEDINNRVTSDKPKAGKRPREKAEALPIVVKSTIPNPCLMVWNLADDMPGESRNDVIKEAIKAGVATATAKTQYQRWFAEKKKEAAKKELEKA